MESINVYLFTASGSYMSQYHVTNAQGQATFNLPQEDYKVRADYLSGQYFSDIFNWIDTEVDIDHGLVDLHVTFNEEDVFDAPVYLFTESGSYLGRYERTDEYGHTEFLIPSKSYKFRVDYEGNQYWSDVVNVIAHEETDVELPLDQLALNLTNDPRPVRFDGKPPIFKGEEIKLASIGTLTGILSQTVVASISPPKVYYYLHNYLGTPQIMTDENGIVVWEAKYKPFGEADVNPASITTNNFRFPGQYYDEESRLHYNYHRYYNPGTGRYLTPDPIGLLVGINLYNYCANRPINFIDPQGLKEICIPWFALKTKWQEVWDTEQWKHTGTKILLVGVSGACYWTKYKRGVKKREITPRKLCWDSCETKKLYIKKGKDFIKRERFEVIIDTDITPIRWLLPIGGFAWRYECDRNCRSPFMPDKD